MSKNRFEKSMRMDAVNAIPILKLRILRVALSIVCIINSVNLASPAGANYFAGHSALSLFFGIWQLMGVGLMWVPRMNRIGYWATLIMLVSSGLLRLAMDEGISTAWVVYSAALWLLIPEE